MIVPIVACAILLRLGASAMGPQSESPAAPESLETATSATTTIDPRERLTADDATHEERVTVAAGLLANDLDSVLTALRDGTDARVVAAILAATANGAAARPNVVALLPHVLPRFDSAENGARARAALVAIYAAHPEPTRNSLRTLLRRSGDPALASRAALALGETRDVLVVDDLIGALEQAQGRDARDIATALSLVLGASLGPDATKWHEFWAERRTWTRERILEDVLAKTRTEFAEEIDRKDKELVRTIREKDEKNPQALILDLDHELVEVRRFAAELLERGMPGWDVSPARSVVLRRLAAGGESTTVHVAFLQLLRAIDLKDAGGRESERDAAIANSLGSPEPSIVVAAVVCAETFPSNEAKEAIKNAIDRFTTRPLTADARIALVKACAAGRLNLVAARDSLVAVLKNDDVAEVRASAASTIGSLKIPDTVDELTTAFTSDGDWRVRRRAASALSRSAGAAARDILARGFEDPRPEVRSEVATALAATSAEGVIDLLLARLQVEEELTVRASLVRALGDLRDAAALPRLVGMAVEPPPPADADAAQLAFRVDVHAAIGQIAGDAWEVWESVLETAVNENAPWLEIFARTARVRILPSGEPNAQRRFDERRELAEVQARVEDWGAATRTIATALEETNVDQGVPRSSLSALAVRLGEFHERRGDGAQAADAYGRALGFDGLEPQRAVEVRILAAENYLRAGNARAAVDLLTRPGRTTRETWLFARASRAAAANTTDAAGTAATAAALLRVVVEELESGGGPPADAFRARLDLCDALIAAGDPAAAKEVPKEAPDDADDASRVQLEKLRLQLAPKSEAGASGA